MPKPVKKSQPKAKRPKAKKKSTAKRPSSDPNVRAHQVIAAMESKQRQAGSTGTVDTKGRFTPDPPGPSVVSTFEEQFKARMSELGRKGGKASGAKRMQNLSPSKRKEIARLAATARWASKPAGS
jgi:general stress protein YciG